MYYIINRTATECNAFFFFFLSENGFTSGKQLTSTIFNLTIISKSNIISLDLWGVCVTNRPVEFGDGVGGRLPDVGRHVHDCLLDG